MYELGGASAEQELNNTDVFLKSFPYPAYTNDTFVIVLQTQFPFIVMLSFIITAPIICKEIVLEKEKKLKVGFASDVLRTSAKAVIFVSV